MVGAVARVTRLITWDAITQPLRRAVLDALLFNRTQRAARRSGQPIPAPKRRHIAIIRVHAHRWARKLLSCPWCVGLWVSAAAVAVLHVVGPQPYIVLPGSALALSYAVGLLSGLETDRREAARKEARDPSVTASPPMPVGAAGE